MADKRDEIIRTQMDVIETLIGNNLKRVADDFWGRASSKSTGQHAQAHARHPRAHPRGRA